jgi:hypothetical protein
VPLCLADFPNLHCFLLYPVSILSSSISIFVCNILWCSSYIQIGDMEICTLDLPRGPSVSLPVIWTLDGLLF